MANLSTTKYEDVTAPVPSAGQAIMYLNLVSATTEFYLYANSAHPPLLTPEFQVNFVEPNQNLIPIPETNM